MTFRASATVGATLLGFAWASLPAAAGVVPHGTYAQSCRHIRVDGPFLTAACARIDGSFRWTRIFAPRCGGVEISNQNGRLTCGE